MVNHYSARLVNSQGTPGLFRKNVSHGQDPPPDAIVTLRAYCYDVDENFVSNGHRGGIESDESD
ncbi:MAG: hypothetical protein EG828_02420 [Deltaproteobacteria bacterium]|nr:hypothetical protein [Deltaproteobacteria bacterium]